ncbi:subtilisin-like protein [Lactarius quietus]|nr:subtilisin-like protein [Lactarius quietus]
MHTKHSWTSVPSNWESLGCPPAGTTIDLYVALKPHRENALTDMLYEVSDPMHRKHVLRTTHSYGAYLNMEQVAELVAPHPDTLELVYSWLRHHGVPSSSSSVTHGGSSLILTGVIVSQANHLLGASYQLYNHVETNETILRTISYSLPAVLDAHVQTVAPTTCFVSPCTPWHVSRNHSSRAAGMEKVISGEPVRRVSNRDESHDTTPSFLSRLYNTWSYTPSATLWNDLGIVGFDPQYPSPTDLKLFMDKYRSGAAATFTVMQINGGGYNPMRPELEANVDVQIADGMAYPTPLTYYSTGRGPLGTDDSYISWLKYAIDDPFIPPTISTSYGHEEKEYPWDHAIFVCRLFAQLGARGVSVLFASGDYGVGSEDCGAKFGNVQFDTLFPATCPFVTSVGGTTGAYPEIAAKISGGGFSNYFARPPYQRQAVPVFLKQLGNKYQGLYNPFGRGSPDISAQALNFPFFFTGVKDLANGTSASTPVVAGIISLLNDYRISQGKPTLGYLNPWLYGRARPGLNDVKFGSNPGCDTEGFTAVAGWDPVTGLGTPDFVQLQMVLPIK